MTTIKLSIVEFFPDTIGMVLFIFAMLYTGGMCVYIFYHSIFEQGIEARENFPGNKKWILGIYISVMIGIILLFTVGPLIF